MRADPVGWPWLRTQEATRVICQLWPDPQPATVVTRDGPHQCCAEFGLVTECDGQIDQLFCGICDRHWSRPCVSGDFVPAVEGEA